MTIKNSAVYDALKWLALIGLPAFGTLYFALAGIWGLPAADQVTGTVLAVDAFLGVVLGISTSNYSSESVGDIVIEESPTGQKKVSLELNDENVDEQLEDIDEARFNVKPLASASRHRTGRRKPRG